MPSYMQLCQSPSGHTYLHCLRLIKSLYGISAAPKLFYEHARDAFLNLGFKQSTVDPCLFIKVNLMVVLYVDDVGIAAKYEKDITWLVDGLRKAGFSLTEEGSLAEFLGIKFETLGEHKFKLTQ